MNVVDSCGWIEYLAEGRNARVRAEEPAQAGE